MMYKKDIHKKMPLGNWFRVLRISFIILIRYLGVNTLFYFLRVCERGGQRESVDTRTPGEGSGTGFQRRLQNVKNP